MIVHAYHGWAGSGAIWQTLAAEFGPSIRFVAYDRGYYGDNRNISDHEMPDVLLTHSMGWMFVPESVLRGAGKVIILNGFANFLSTKPEVARRVRAMTTMMQSNLARNPTGQVAAFNEVAGLSDQSDRGSLIDDQLLDRDLEMLITKRLPSDMFAETAGVCFVHSTEDPIVHPSVIQETEDMFQSARHILLESSKHNLPITHAGWIRNLILDK